MSWGALGWAAKQRPGKIADKLVLIALADRHNEEQDIAWPSIAWLCEFTGADRKTIITSLDRLETLGFITDSGERFGKTKQVKGYKLALNNTEKGIPKTEPLGEKSSVFPPKQSQKRDTEPSREPSVDKAKALPTKRASVPTMPEGVELNVWNDFLELRKAKRAPLSNTALAAIEREAAKAGWSLNDALAESAARGWQGFKADWVREKSNGQHHSNQSGGRTVNAAASVIARLGGTGMEAGTGRSPTGGYANSDPAVDALPSALLAIGHDARRP